MRQGLGLEHDGLGRKRPTPNTTGAISDNEDPMIANGKALRSILTLASDSSFHREAWALVRLAHELTGQLKDD